MKKFALVLGFAALLASPVIADDFTETPTDFTGEVTTFEVTDPFVTEGNVANENAADLYAAPDLERVETRLPRTDRVLTERRDPTRSIYDPNSIYRNQGLDVVPNDDPTVRNLRPETYVDSNRKVKTTERVESGRGIATTRTIRGYVITPR